MKHLSLTAGQIAEMVKGTLKGAADRVITAFRASRMPKPTSSLSAATRNTSISSKARRPASYWSAPIWPGNPLKTVR